MTDEVKMDLILPVLRKFSDSTHVGSVVQHNADASFLLEHGLLCVTEHGEVITTHAGENYLAGRPGPRSNR